MCGRKRSFHRHQLRGFRDLPEEVRRHGTVTHGTLEERLHAVEYEMIKSALEKTNGIQTQAAEILGISERVLRYKMKKAGINSV
jgi:two-component system, NtrC family, response regulator AtoC